MDSSPTFFLKDLFFSPSLLQIQDFPPSAWKFTYIFQRSLLFLCEFNTFGRLYVRMGDVTEGECWRCRFRRCCWWPRRLFCDPPEITWTMPEKSSDTWACLDSQTFTAVGWWRHLSRACSLLAWVAKWLLSFSVLGLRLTLWGQSLTLRSCQTLRPGKFLSTWNASLCRWNLIHFPPPHQHTAQTYC